MALTLEAEQRLERAGLVDLFDTDQAIWTGVAEQAYEFVTLNFPDGATVRQDDVAKALMPLLEINEGLTNALNEKKLRQKYWRNDFGDLILDRSWQQLTA